MPRYNELEASADNPCFFHYHHKKKGKLVVCVPNNVRFQCIQCGDCCRANAPPLSTKDIKRLLHVNKTDFMEERDPENNSAVSLTRFYLKRNKKGYCIFFDDHKNTCEVYNNRPYVCRTYPMEFNPGGQAAIGSPTVTYIIERAKGDPTKTLCQGFTQEFPEKSDYDGFIDALRIRFTEALKYAHRVADRMKLNSMREKGLVR